MLCLMACAPKVDPRSPFDEDDPRAGEAARARVAAPEPVAVAPKAEEPPGPVVREGTFERAAMRARLDAQPGALLKCIEVDAVEEAGKFAGWRLVRFIRGCDAFAGLDVAVGDVLVSVNGRVIVKPADLSALWAELYEAQTIVAELRRGTERVVLRFAITDPAPAAPAAPPVPAS